MSHSRLPLLTVLTVLTAAATTAGHAAPPAQKAIQNFYQAVETTAGAVTLPTSRDGSVVVMPCAGCAPKTFHAVADTQYRLGEQAVTLPELKAAVVGRPGTFVTVIYHEKTNELYSISASVDSPVTAPPAKAGRNRQPTR